MAKTNLVNKTVQEGSTLHRALVYLQTHGEADIATLAANLDCEVRSLRALMQQCIGRGLMTARPAKLDAFEGRIAYSLQTEHAVHQLVLSGWTDTQIADQLGIAESEVTAHIWVCSMVPRIRDLVHRGIVSVKAAIDAIKATGCKAFFALTQAFVGLGRGVKTGGLLYSFVSFSPKATCRPSKRTAQRDGNNSESGSSTLIDVFAGAASVFGAGFNALKTTSSDKSNPKTARRYTMDSIKQLLSGKDMIRSV